MTWSRFMWFATRYCISCWNIDMPDLWSSTHTWHDPCQMPITESTAADLWCYIATYPTFSPSNHGISWHLNWVTPTAIKLWWDIVWEKLRNNWLVRLNCTYCYTNKIMMHCYCYDVKEVAILNSNKLHILVIAKKKIWSLSKNIGRSFVLWKVKEKKMSSAYIIFRLEQLRT